VSEWLLSHSKQRHERSETVLPSKGRRKHKYCYSCRSRLTKGTPMQEELDSEVKVVHTATTTTRSTTNQ
jgi:hypothetical protein